MKASSKGLVPLFLAVLLVGELSAQDFVRIDGRVLERVSDRPIPGATVMVRGGEGEVLAGTFSAPDGTFHLRIPVGTFRAAADELQLIAERIGYDETLVALPTSFEGIQPFDLRLEPRPLVLAGLEAAADPRCGSTDPAAANLIYGLWTDARVALRAAVVAGDEGLVRFRTRVWTRTLNDRGQLLRVAHNEEGEALRHPFHTLLPRELAEEGYVREGEEGWVFHAPDANVLLSESFADTHCFSLERGGLLRNRGMVGLAFEPLPGHSHIDIRGVLWMDERSGELRRIEYDYVRDGEALEPRARGEIELRALPDGPWIVERWWIRTPVGGVVDDRGRMLRYHYRERGGEVIEILGAMRS